MFAITPRRNFDFAFPILRDEVDDDKVGNEVLCFGEKSCDESKDAPIPLLEYVLLLVMREGNIEFVGTRKGHPIRQLIGCTSMLKSLYRIAEKLSRVCRR